MALTITSLPVPLREDAQGVLRVGNTRVTLDTVLTAYKGGAVPEQIVRDFDTLKLADVYAVIGYYLLHRAEVEAYLRERRRVAREVRKEAEARFDQTGLKERLLARRKQAQS
jgi:uncharacterized protein (DUF433 family)